MELTLKKVKVIKEMSDETNCYYAEVYVDGVKAFSAENEGHGGPDEFTPLSEEGKKLLEQAEEYAKALPPFKFTGLGGDDDELPYDLELLIGDLLEKYEETKFFKRLCKTHLVFRATGQSEMGYYQIKTPHPEDQKLRDKVIAKYPGATILNDQYV
jgi:hypothetical protein